MTEWIDPTANVATTLGVLLALFLALRETMLARSLNEQLDYSQAGLISAWVEVREVDGNRRPWLVIFNASSQPIFQVHAVVIYQDRPAGQPSTWHLQEMVIPPAADVSRAAAWVVTEPYRPPLGASERFQIGASYRHGEAMTVSYFTFRDSAGGEFERTGRGHLTLSRFPSRLPPRGRLRYWLFKRREAREREAGDKAAAQFEETTKQLLAQDRQARDPDRAD